MRKLILAAVLVALIMPAASCGDDQAAETQTAAGEAHNYAHQAPRELEQVIIDDVKEDLGIISTVRADPAPFTQAMTDVALADIQNQHAKDLAEGRYRVRVYENIEVRVTGYTDPIAEALVEFDDKSYYADSATGTAIDSPANERTGFAMALVEEEGQWKIKGIFSPSGAETAQPGE